MTRKSGTVEREIGPAGKTSASPCSGAVAAVTLVAVMCCGCTFVIPNARTRTDLSLEDYFRAFIEEHENSMTETELAERLGMSRKALWERRQRLGMPRAGKR